jgi:hypothetical protein
MQDDPTSTGASATSTGTSATSAQTEPQPMMITESNRDTYVMLCVDAAADIPI